jgi:DNA replication and repair protein RecF
VDAARRRYVEALGATLSAVMATLLPDLELELRYWPGWSGERSLEAALTQSLVRDEAAGTTQVGPHRADLLLQDAHGPVREHVSRGQQKLLAAALVLAQLERFQADRGEAGVLLLDDPAAELDAEFLRRLMDRVLQMPVQLFMTGLDTAGLPLERPHRLFHVEHGTITRPA